MKYPIKTIFQNLFIVVLALSATTSFAQRRFDPDRDSERFFRFGAKGGVNINKINGQSYKDGFNYNYLVGGFMQFNFSRRFGIQPEVNFVQSSSEFASDASTVYDDLFYNGDQRKAKLDYLKVPVFLNINIGPSKRVKLQVGPQYGNVLKETVDSLKNNGNIFKQAQWAAVGGVWFQLPFINLGARYELGLNNINDIDNRERWRSQAFTIFAGITF